MQGRINTTRINSIHTNRVNIPVSTQLALPAGKPLQVGRITKYAAAIIAYEGNSQWAVALVHEEDDGRFWPEWFRGMTYDDAAKLLHENKGRIVRKDLDQEDSLGTATPRRLKRHERRMG